MICQPMKAQSISTPGRAKKIIIIIWLTVISLSSVIVPFVTGVSIGTVFVEILRCFNFHVLLTY